MALANESHCLSRVSRRLAQWMHDTDNTVMSVGRRLRCSPSHVTHLRRGRRKPGLGIALAIERMTEEWPEGPIRVEEWEFDGSINAEDPADTREGERGAA